MYHTTLCQSIKSQHFNTSRCPYNCVNGTQFCGRHLRMKNPILYKPPAAIKSDGYNNTYIIRSSSFPYEMTDATILLESLHYYEINVDISTFEDKLYLYRRLIDFLKTQDVYSESIDKIIIIQKIGRGYLRKQRNKCCNKEDLLTLDSIHRIDDKYYIQFMDGSEYYGFDMRFLYGHMILNKNKFNPYKPGTNFSDSALLKIEEKLNYYERRGINLKITPKLELLTDDQKFELKVVDIFHKIDQLDNYTQASWFLELSFDRLKHLYVQLEDIWNYRAEIPVLRKKDIIHPGKLFVVTPSAINTYSNAPGTKRIIQNLLLAIFERLITEGKTVDDKKLGAIYLLTAMVIVSIPAADSYPWLVQPL